MQNQNLLAERQLESYPEEQAWKRESRQADRDEREYTKHLRDFQKSMEPLVRMEAVDKMLRIVSNKTTLSNHDAVTANVYRQLNISPEQAQAGESAAQIAEQARAAGMDPETYYQTVYKPKQLMTWEQKFELMKVEIGKTPKDPIVGSPKWEESERKKAEIKREFAPDKTETVPTGMKDFELTTYGKERPDLRGSKEYIGKRLEWIKSQKEQSPYVDALNRQVDVTAKREGTNLRKEFYDQVEVKEANDIKRKYEVMNEAFKESKTTKNFVAVDQAIITLFNKMTDPQSVVRESEYARTASDLALWHRIKGKVSKLVSGGAGLSQDDREAVFKMAGKFQEVAQRKYKARLHEYKGYLSNYGLDPDKYLTPYGEGERTVEPGTPRTAEEYMKKFEVK